MNTFAKAEHRPGEVETDVCAVEVEADLLTQLPVLIGGYMKRVAGDFERVLAPADRVWVYEAGACEILALGRDDAEFGESRSIICRRDADAEDVGRERGDDEVEIARVGGELARGAL
jgi:hypothetical protein